jgi:hypothetical protein
MESTSQQQSPPPCECQQQFGDVLPWLAVALAFIVVLDRWSDRRKKKKDVKPDGTAGGHSESGGNT